MADSRRPTLWSNILLRTTVYYLLVIAVGLLVRDRGVGGLGAITGSDIAGAFGAVSKREALQSTGTTGPAVLPTFIAMLSAGLLALPIAWVYTLTRRKKGYQQAVVQTLVMLPVVVAGVVVLVKHSLALAFSLGGIVAAVRFRTSLDDSKDAVHVFIATGIGLAAGVDPDIAFILSLGFNLMMALLWYTDFGDSPALLEGRKARERLERAVAAGRTGTFVARLDDEVLKSLAPEQLDAIADRAWRRRKRNDPELNDEPTAPRPVYAVLLRVRTENVETTRTLLEPLFGELFVRWKYVGAVKQDDGSRFAEWGVDYASTVTSGVVVDALKAVPEGGVLKVELR
ncbi:MAG: DUF4956 domain-containing protein [Gemmatimonadaceae bacterium]|nr:DUF4956 domain-containing protein [Gemmatimonadaceae bacterium]